MARPRDIGMTHRITPLAAVVFSALALVVLRIPASADPPTPESVEFFEKKVRPILADHCYACHSAASKTSLGGLRLDSHEGLLKGGDRGSELTPATPEKSRLLTAIGYQDHALQMPPTGRLTDEQIAVLTRWVKEGAVWPAGSAAVAPPAKPVFNLKERARHWAFQPVKAAMPPKVHNAAWSRNAIDNFILAKLEANNMAPAPPADRRTLIRRVTFDLIGLPPTPAEIDAFLADRSPDAYRKVVDRLLASPHYGERWARHWLDLARYAETDGHEQDFEKPGPYEYRDYVIRALNADLPYNQFVREQVAGDLLPHPRINPKDGFNESLVGTGFWYLGEATHSPVDLLDDEAIRVDNQIDVFSKTFLGLSVGCARCHDHKFDPIPTKDYYALSGFLHSSRYQVASLVPSERVQPAIHQLEQVNAQLSSLAAQTSAASYIQPETPAGATVFEDFSHPDWRGWYATGEAFGAGPQAESLMVNAPAGHEPHLERLTGSRVADGGGLSERLQGVLRSRTFKISTSKIFYHMAGHDAEVNLIIDNFELIQDPIYGGLKIHPDNRDHMAWYSQDVSKWKGHRAFIELRDPGHARLVVDRILFSDGPVPTEPKSTARAAVFTGSGSSARTASLNGGEERAARLQTLLSQKAEIEATLPEPRWAMAMADGTGENDHVHIRGNSATLGPEVGRRFLEVFDGPRPLVSRDDCGRLELADRLVAPTDPLLPRVIVNRLWLHHFGEGIVRTPDDFGIMGQKPTHPELLDYLATQLVRNGWSLKQMHRMMVLSSAYQMSSRPEPEIDRRDPSNLLLHRMPVRRLEGEAVRDAILAVSGRLDSKLYGPSVRPFLTPFMEGRNRPETGPLDGAGRRSIYIGVRRNFLTPLFLAFDYPVPFTTMGRRTVSNVPAQALTLMNDPFVLQQAQVWADRVLAKPGLTPRDRVVSMYQTIFGRPPAKEELAAALAFLVDQSRRYGAADSPSAWRDLCHVLFNVKEFIFIA
jgi:hypothetical protein